MAKTSNRERQDRLKQLETDLGSFAQVLAPLEEKFNGLKSRLDQEKSSIQGTLENLETQIKTLETQLHEQLQALPDDIRQKYQRIGRSVQPPAASANGGTCHGCFMHLPPQLFIDIQKGHQVHSCPNCHRLLYLEVE
jgi:predicted  nucleic acid-binding Zn-ribbon protein